MASSAWQKSLNEVFNKFHRDHPDHLEPWVLSVNSHNPAATVLQITLHTIVRTSDGEQNFQAFHIDFVHGFDMSGITLAQKQFGWYPAELRKRYGRSIAIVTAFLNSQRIRPSVIIADTKELLLFFNLPKLQHSALDLLHLSRDILKLFCGMTVQQLLRNDDNKPEKYFVQHFPKAFKDALVSVAAELIKYNNQLFTSNPHERRNFRFKSEIFDTTIEESLLKNLKASMPVECKETYTGRKATKIVGMEIIISRVFKFLRTLWARGQLGTADDLMKNAKELVSAAKKVLEIFEPPTRVRFIAQYKMSPRGLIFDQSSDSALASPLLGPVLQSIEVYTRLFSDHPTARLENVLLCFDYEFGSLHGPVINKTIAKRVVEGMDYSELKHSNIDSGWYYLSVWCGDVKIPVRYIPTVPRGTPEEREAAKRGIAEFLQHEPNDYVRKGVVANYRMAKVVARNVKGSTVRKFSPPKTTLNKRAGPSTSGSATKRQKKSRAVETRQKKREAQNDPSGEDDSPAEGSDDPAYNPQSSSD